MSRKVQTVVACLRCHATWPAEAQSPQQPPVQLNLGVSCQACHGAGQKWFFAHQLSPYLWRVVAADEKARLYRETGALAVDMESHVASRIAARRGLPFAALRIISDAADMTLPPAALVGMRPDGGVASGAILRSLARHPGQLPALIRLGRDAGTAFRVLGGVHDALRRGGIGGLDPGQFPLDMG